MRYPQNYLNFMTLMHSYGQKSAEQYSILHAATGGPCPRTLQNLIKHPPDCLSSPNLDFENVARVKQFVDTIRYDGPVASASDCTKVHKWLTYSNDYGSHILGSVLPLLECIADDFDDIDTLVEHVGDEEMIATRCRASLLSCTLLDKPVHEYQ
ncbi:hypothetical protein C8Q80DRAFT_1118279 [Daedaleopsis nitida]|nr:hypothetical protein C8Q80DRAFT_1118279 [Daedaleopsis nitida]